MIRLFVRMDIHYMTAYVLFEFFPLFLASLIFFIYKYIPSVIIFTRFFLLMLLPGIEGSRS